LRLKKQLRTRWRQEETCMNKISLPPPSRIDGVSRRQPGRRKIMAWIAANWFWVLIFIAFIAMHMFGHGGHGSHGGHGGGPRDKNERDRNNDTARGNPVNAGARGHQH